MELYRFQAEEIDAAELDADEYDELEARASVLKNLEKIKKDASGVHAALYEVDGSVLERLKMMSAMLAELAVVDPKAKPIAGAVRDATIQLEEAAFDLSRYLDKLDLDPGRAGGGGGAAEHGQPCVKQVQRHGGGDAGVPGGDRAEDQGSGERVGGSGTLNAGARAVDEGG